MPASSAPEVVKPAYCWMPDRVSSGGVEAIELARLAGIDLDPEQELAIDAIMSERGGGRWSALEAAVIEPRQNGKTGGVILPVVLAQVYLVGVGLVVWTSHRFRTSQESFLELKGVIQSTDFLERRIKRISEANGEEGVEFTNGSRVDFLARSKGSGRGLSGDLVVLDEAFDLNAGHMGALFPTLSARPNPQVLYGSSAGQAHSDVLRNLRDRGRAGGDPSLVYVEWCAPEDSCRFGDACRHVIGTAGCALDREDFWQRANPAMGKRITVEFIRAERRAMPPDEFGRERLGWWDPPLSGEQPIELAAWIRCNADRRRPKKTTPIFFPDVSPGMKSSSIGVAFPVKGVPHAELAYYDSGTDGLVAKSRALRKRFPQAVWAVEGQGAIGSLVPEFEEAGFTFESFTAGDMGRGCGHLQKLVADGAMSHADDPLFTTALAGAVKRDVGEGLWAWGRRKSTTDISPLVAVTGALWALEVYGAYDLLESVY
ncbi:MAG TPA: hypothetical protein VKD66_14390 [Streptosporangiaceae bacterium]|nr:hypothetical protein [Streptosporangiaceae bacterium]